MSTIIILLVVILATSVHAFAPAILRSNSLAVPRIVNTQLFGARNRAWAKGDLSDKDIFEGGDDDVTRKEKIKLETETIFFEGPPAASELIFPAISILTVIGIVPFLAALSRQFLVKYKITSRRISILSGLGGKTETVIIYPDIEEIRFVYRSFGSAGDMVLFLKDGAKVEMRFVGNFDETYNYILSKCDEDCKSKCKQITPAN